MKLAASLLLLGFAGVVYAGPESIIKQRAKDIRDQNNARQGVAPSAAPRPVYPAQPAARPAVSAQPSATTRLQADLNAIKSGVQVTDAQKESLARSLMAASQGSNKPSLANADKLANSLASALNEKLVTNALRSRLLQNVQGILNAHTMGPEQTQAVIEDVQKSLQGAGISEAAANKVAQDLRLVAADVQKASKK